MPDKPDLPDGFSFTAPRIPPPGSRRASSAEVEQELLQKLKKQETAHRNALYQMVVFYNQTDQQKRALPYMERLSSLADSPGDKAANFFTLGQLMEGLNNFQAAVEFYSRAHRLEPTDQQLWYFINNNLGFSLNQLSRYKEAEVYCRTAIKVNPQLYNAHKNLGLSLQGQRNFAEAALCLVQSVKANAGDPRALNHLSDLLADHPELFKENPALVLELQFCRQANAFATGTINELIRKYYC